MEFLRGFLFGFLEDPPVDIHVVVDHLLVALANEIAVRASAISILILIPTQVATHVRSILYIPVTILMLFDVRTEENVGVAGVIT